MNIEAIIKKFCVVRNTDMDCLFGESIKYHDCHNRYILWTYLHDKRGVSANKLARMFNRNRPSVFRGIRLYKHLLRYDRHEHRIYSDIVKKMESADKATPSDDI